MKTKDQLAGIFWGKQRVEGILGFVLQHCPEFNEWLRALNKFLLLPSKKWICRFLQADNIFLLKKILCYPSWSMIECK